MTYRFAEDTRATHPELMDRTFTELETRNVYENIIDKNEYADFEEWMADMLKTGLITKETGEAIGRGDGEDEMLAHNKGDPANTRTVAPHRSSSLRYCRAEPSPYPLGKHGQYDYFVERLFPNGEKAGSATIGPVIYIGRGKDAQTFVGIINGQSTDYRDALLECAEMRRCLGIRVMEGDDYLPDYLAAERQSLERWTQQKSQIVITEMRELGYIYDEALSDSSAFGKKVFKNTGGRFERYDISFQSDEEALRWILDHPDTSNIRIQAIYEQLNPEKMEAALEENKDLYRTVMHDTFRLDEPEPDREAAFSPYKTQRHAGIRR